MNMLGEFPDKKHETLQFGIIIIPVLIRKFKSGGFLRSYEKLIQKKIKNLSVLKILNAS